MKISKKATTIAIVNQKGGTGKTTTCENLGIGLAMEGKKVLLVDTDPQGSLTISMGWQQPDELPATLSTLMQKAMNDQPIQPGEGILHHAEGVDLIPANIELAGLEVALVNSMNREKMLKQVLDGAKREYDYILLDCTPSLGMLTINALAAADTALIPVQAQYLSAKGLEQLLQTICKVHRQKINPKLKIEGILLTMTDSRTNYGKQIDTLIRQASPKSPFSLMNSGIFSNPEFKTALHNARRSFCYIGSAQGRPFFIRRNKPMKLTFEEKKLLYTYGCADLELTRKRLYEIAGLTVDPNQNKLVYDFCRKLEDETLADWYDQMFYFVRAEMECYTNMLLLMQDIEEDKEWRKEDFVDPDDNV